ncbi:phosphotransferase family protein [Kytococcus sedentarius]|uniref:phosphotransferase family protein n=1 Tax=Kytococcus sedentarius TaxID=1276 RepID=UPI0035BC25DC
MAAAPSTPGERLAAALDLVIEAEQREQSLPTGDPSSVWARGRVVRRPALPEQLVALLPHAEREDWGPHEPDVTVRESPVAADLVVLAKFDVNAGIKLRVAYGEGLTLAIQPPSPSGLDGIARAVAAHQAVARHAPGFMPALLGHGHLASGMPYLVESWLEGEPLVTGRRLADATPEILQHLAAVHRGLGVDGVPLATHWEHLLGRWEETVATGIVPDRLRTWIDSLLRREGRLRRSWVHGDLVASNAMSTPKGVALIDWEHSQVAPLMNDAAKLHLFSPDPERTLQEALHGFSDAPSGSGRLSGPGTYSPAEELALAHAQLISRYPRRRAALEGHPRAEIFEQQIQRQVERLEQVRQAA